MTSDRGWMYRRLDNGYVGDEFFRGVEEFVNFAVQNDPFKYEGHLRCPCARCQNVKFQSVEHVKLDLYKRGFMKDYGVWTSHGESRTNRRCTMEMGSSSLIPESNPIRSMVVDLFGPVVQDDGSEDCNVREENPVPKAKKLFDMLDATKKPVYEGCSMSILEASSRLVNLKCEYNIPQRAIDAICSLVKDLCPEDNVMTSSLYSTNKLTKGIRLPAEKIDCCPNGCMLFWKDCLHLNNCSICLASRWVENATSVKKRRIPVKVLRYFPITPRLQRLYATKGTTKAMQWHASRTTTGGLMTHPSDSDAWKHLDSTYPSFAADTRNVRLGLCTDGFAPFGKAGKDYSCWPVMCTPYNLPPWLCMKTEYVFLSLLIPGPSSPKGNLDVYLQPLIEELKQLWNEGEPTYDINRKKNFQMRAALLWTVSDFPAYAMLSGWSTAGRLACPYCMEYTKSFTLKNGRKQTWFDCSRRFLPLSHPYRQNKSGFFKNRAETDFPIPIPSGEELRERVSSIPTTVERFIHNLRKEAPGLHVHHNWSKQSIFWQLPYWSNLLIRHNLDVMHIEKNVFDNVINTVMDVPGKSKDTKTSRMDLQLYCKRPKLELKKVQCDSRQGNGKTFMPHAPYVLKKEGKKAVCEWVKGLKFPDGYASDLKRCVHDKDLTLTKFKSHDCHVFMQRLLPIAFKELLPSNVWQALTELSQFFRDLCANNIHHEDMERLERNIPEIICKLERIFPPAFFNCMEHLPLHLAYEEKIAGPVHYRWMYPFERFLHHLKQKIGNQARVEGSICEAYLMEEESNFCRRYFGVDVDTKSKDPIRNFAVGSAPEVSPNLPRVFSCNNGYILHKGKGRKLGDDEYWAAHRYVLGNCHVLQPFEQLFEEEMVQSRHVRTPGEAWNRYGQMWPKWLRNHVHTSYEEHDIVRTIGIGPSLYAHKYSQYCVNGFLFDTYNHGSGKATHNYGVSVKTDGGPDYYGILQEILELTYVGKDAHHKVVLFKCDWFDSLSGMREHKEYRLVDIDRTKKYRVAYDSYILAYQAQQVCFMPYPSLRPNKWWAVIKIKARGLVDTSEEENAFQDDVNHNPPSLYEPEPEDVECCLNLDNAGKDGVTFEDELVDDEEVPMEDEDGEDREEEEAELVLGEYQEDEEEEEEGYFDEEDSDTDEADAASSEDSKDDEEAYSD